MITAYSPKDWKDLQNQVGKIFCECGFQVEIEKKARIARGEVEIDVLAEEEVKGRRYKIICECKYWESKVPQTIIHAFRTVMADFGAHKGYIVSANGFQAGAFEASDLTNIELVTWPEFQERFCRTWLEHFFSPVITKHLDRLMGFTEPLPQSWMCNIPDHEAVVVKALRTKYQDVGMLALGLSTYGRMLKKLEFPSLPLRSNYKGDFKEEFVLPDEILDATGYRELLMAFLKYGESGIKEFQEVKDRNHV